MSEKLREVTVEAWEAEGVSKFGADRMAWRFTCPSCKHEASVQDWKDAGATSGMAAYSCIGRNLGADDKHTFKGAGGPCNYAGGGLFGLNPVRVLSPDGKHNDVFEFAATEVRP